MEVNVVKLLLGLIQFVQRDCERRASAHELLSFNDCLLKDIGLRRSQIGDNGTVLFKETKPVIRRQRPTAISHVRPSLQGCG